MGFTHYWSIPGQLTKSHMELIANDVKKLVAAAEERGIKIVADPDDSPLEDPIITDTEIFLNGFPGYETFFIRRDRGGFCKTERKPYDLVVASSLIVLAHYVPQVDVSSDAQNRDGTHEQIWQDAMDFCQEVLGYGADFKFKED